MKDKEKKMQQKMKGYESCGTDREQGEHHSTGDETNWQ